MVLVDLKCMLLTVSFCCILAKIIQFMEKHNNFQLNFSLEGYGSIQIGLYFLITAYVIKNILAGFLIDDHLLGMMSAEIIVVLISVVTFLMFLFSSFALFFKGRRKAKKLQYNLWNTKTTINFWKYLVNFFLMFVLLIFLEKQGLIDYLTPTFLILYGLLLLLLRTENSKNLFILTGICVLLAIICFIIPTYWYSSIYILGVAHITYGVVLK